MRPLFVNITGSTDATGNASIPVKLPTTGEWHNVKFALSTTQTCEWAVLVAGRPYTFGRGRRVTLGPELILDGETVTISVLGAGTRAAIDGTASGTSGFPEEILQGFSPHPNTVSMDTSTDVAFLGLLSGGAESNPTGTFEVPGGTQSIGYLVYGSERSFNPINQVIVFGNTSGNQYVSVSSALGFDGIGGIIWAPFSSLTDAQVLCQIGVGPGLGVGRVDFFTSPLQFTSLMLQNNGAVPALWQVPQKIVTNTLAVTGTAPLLAGVAGQVIRLWDWQIDIDGQVSGTTQAFLEDTGTGVAKATCALSGGAAGAPVATSNQGSRSGAALDTAGATGGLQLHVVNLGGSATVRAYASVSQG